MNRATRRAHAAEQRSQSTERSIGHLGGAEQREVLIELLVELEAGGTA